MKQLTVFLLHPDRKLGTSRLKNDTSARKAFKNLRRVLLINRCHTNFVPRPATHSLVAARSVGSGNKMVLREESRTSIHSCTVALWSQGFPLRSTPRLCHVAFLMNNLINTEVFICPIMVLYLQVTNGQFLLGDASTGNHGSCIHQNKYPVKDDEFN